MADEKLTREELNILQEYARPGLLKQKIPPAIKSKLTALGFIEDRLGATVITSKGKMFLLIGR